jgi:hypothetical protein
MPNDINVQPVCPVQATRDVAGDVKTSAIAMPEAQQPTTPSPIPNPTLRLDPALGLVVLEFHSDTGAVTSSIPSQRQLQAYQKWDATHFGTAPDGARDTSAQQQEETPLYAARRSSVS